MPGSSPVIHGSNAYNVRSYHIARLVPSSFSQMMKNAHCLPNEVFQNIPKEERKQHSREHSISNPDSRKEMLALLSPDSKAALRIRDKLRNAVAKQEESRRLKKKSSFLKKKALKLATPSEIQVQKSL